MSYAAPEAMYAAVLALSLVTAEFLLPGLAPGWRATRLRLAASGIYVAALAPVLTWHLLPWLAGLVAVLTLGACLKGRDRLGSRLGGTALQVVALVLFILLTARMGPGFPNPDLGPLGPLSRVVVWVTVYLFVLPGGATVVRWVLDESNVDWAGISFPPLAEAVREAAAAGGLPEREASRGKMIGKLERLLVLTLVTQGQFAAIGIVLAAKSVARYPQAAQSEAFADYYLTGTLASMAVAIGSGLLLTGLESILLT